MRIICLFFLFSFIVNKGGGKGGGGRASGRSGRGSTSRRTGSGLLWAIRGIRYFSNKIYGRSRLWFSYH